MEYYSKFDEIIKEIDKNNYDSMNSISFIKLIVRLEEEFKMEFEDDKLFINAFPTKQDLYDYVISKSQLKQK